MVSKGRALVSSPQFFPLKAFLDRLSISQLMFVASAALLINTLLLARFSTFVGFLLTLFGMLVLSRQSQTAKWLNSIQRWGSKYKINVAMTVFFFVGTMLFLDYVADPAQAQFFNQTEGWLRSSFPATAGGGAGGAGGTDIYKLVFNTLRAIFVLYLAVSLVRVVAAQRNDEDWQTLARTPLIILITVTLGDILAGLITGGGSGGSGGGGGTPAP